jgi:hypothetical protein
MSVIHPDCYWRIEMPTLPDSLPQIILIALAVISCAAGIFCLIKFAKTRRPLFLILGLLLTFILPGVCLYLIARTGTPPVDSIMTYGPPPSHDVP